MNSRGVPGAVGAITRDGTGRRFLLTCNHVLFGSGALAGEALWAVREDGGRRVFTQIARASHGYQGQVSRGVAPCYIDGALAEIDDDPDWPAWICDAVSMATGASGIAVAECGTRVEKAGPVTGRTHGTVIDDRYFDRPVFDGRAQDTSGQLLIRSNNADERFSARGESGAAVLDERSCIVAILWGCNTYGDGIAFPIGPLLAHFGMTLECRTPATVPTHV